MRATARVARLGLGAGHKAMKQIAEALEVTRLEVLVVLPPAVKPAERRLS